MSTTIERTRIRSSKGTSGTRHRWRRFRPLEYERSEPVTAAPAAVDIEEEGRKLTARDLAELTWTSGVQS
jgi:hypothetical protein